jgi:hypothetical protein
MPTMERRAFLRRRDLVVETAALVRKLPFGLVRNAESQRR